jgi:hypothetical protein
MPKFSIQRKSVIDENSFRAAAIKGRFSLEKSEISEIFSGEIILPDEWSIGLIYGSSGTGKTTIARELFGDEYLEHLEYDALSVVDDMPEATIEDITKMFVSVGFGSTSSWLKPYSVLSNGEKMRVDLARALLSSKSLIVFDEFTSVVDRNIAKIGSMCVAKAIRRSDKRFIAVSCHDDIIPWLEPDWAFCTDTMSMMKVKKKDQKFPYLFTKWIEIGGDCLLDITI